MSAPTATVTRTVDGEADDAEHRRTAALSLSGWGRTVRLIQPRNLALWVYLLFVGLGVPSLLQLVSRAAAISPTALVVALVVFAIFGAVILWFTVAVDRDVPLPGRLRVAAIVWGGVAATFGLSATAENALTGLLVKAAGPVWSAYWSAAVTAPPAEELGKGAGMLLLVVLAPRVVRTAFDGFVLGASVGLGFQIVEDVGYVLTGAGSQFGANPVLLSVVQATGRIATGVMSHTLMSALFGAGLIWLLGSPAEPRRRGRGLLLVLSALGLHAAWDAIAFPALDLGRGAAAVALTVIGLVLAVAVYRLAAPRERGILRDVLTPEAAAGRLDDVELDALTGGYRAWRRFRRAGLDRTDRHLRAHRLAAAQVLAGEIAHAHGAETHRVAVARAQLARFAGSAGNARH